MTKRVLTLDTTRSGSGKYAALRNLEQAELLAKNLKQRILRKQTHARCAHKLELLRSLQLCWDASALTEPQN